jgi:drug/metabolite transporter (DMT)-like permease
LLFEIWVFCTFAVKMGLSSILAGFYGALAGVLGKYAFSEETGLSRYALDTCNSSGILSPLYCQNVVYVLRAIMVSLMMWVNGLMFSCAFTGLNEDGSLTSTVLSTSTNFLFTAFLGYFLFGEHLSYMWGTGALLVALGIYFVLLGKAKTRRSKKKKE